jgi:AraC-like DNA-binding protein
LLFADSIFKENYLFFEPNLIRNFETPRLLAEKEALISSLTKKNRSISFFGWTFIVLFIMSSVGLLYYFKRQRAFKKRFELLLERGLVKSLEVGNIEQKNHISSEVIRDVLEQLDAFEKSEQFISQEISLHDLAKTFGTNSRYLSRIINLEKEKNFSQYINDLRLEFAFQRLADNDMFRRYTIKAIANDCGFNRAEVFSKAFYRKYKIYPSFYIKKLEEHSKKS